MCLCDDRNFDRNLGNARPIIIIIIIIIILILKPKLITRF